MSMTIKLYNYTGDAIVVNKTGWLTNATLYASLDGVLKDNTSVTDPSIIIENGSMPAANYAYIADLGRYYFINDITALSATLWRLDMHVDVLMSYKGVKSGGSSTGIYALSCYIDRSAQASGTHLIENAYPLLGNATRTKYTATSANTWYSSTSFMDTTNTALNYLILFNGQAKAGGTTYYAAFGLGHILTNANGVTGIMSQLYSQATLLGTSPAEYIYSVKALPLAMAIRTGSTECDTMTIPGIMNDITLDTTTYDYWQTSTRWQTNKWTFTLSAPSSLRFFKNYAPYTSVMLSFQPFGKFALDPALIFAGGTATVNVYVKVDFDVVTGDAALYWGTSSSDVSIYLGSSNVGINVPLMANSYSIAKIVSGAMNVVTAAAGFASGNALGGAIGTANAVLSGASALDPTSSTVSGGNMQIITDPIIEIIHHDIEDVAPNLIGYPDCTTDALYNYAGYVKAGRVHVSNLPGCPTSTEIDEVESLLLAGVEL